MTSRRTAISQEIMARLAVVTAIKTRSFDKIRLLASDFQDWELPLAQVIDLGDNATYINQQRRRTWNLAIEIAIGPKAEDGVNQAELWDLMEEVEVALDALPKLNLSYVIHLKQLGSSTDLHLLEPLYTGRIDLTIDYYSLSSC
jgi:hypothetical protein